MNAQEKVLQLYGKPDGSTWKWLTKNEEEEIRKAATAALMDSGKEVQTTIHASENGSSVAIYVAGHKVAYVMVPNVTENDRTARKALERIEGKADEARQIIEQLRKEIRPSE